MEGYIAKESGLNLTKTFDQYLRSTKIPELEYKLDGGTLAYRWANVVAGFDMPVRVTIPGRGQAMLNPTTTWKSEAGVQSLDGFAVDANWYVTAKAVTP